MWKVTHTVGEHLCDVVPGPPTGRVWQTTMEGDRGGRETRAAGPGFLLGANQRIANGRAGLPAGLQKRGGRTFPPTRSSVTPLPYRNRPDPAAPRHAALSRAHRPCPYPSR
jgi:hypothetical protein